MKNPSDKYLKGWLKNEGSHLIENAIIDHSILAELASNSVEHDNGFLKIVMQERGENNIGMRIHIWQPNKQESNIHSHRWDMAAIILKGGYTASKFNENSDGSLFLKYLFQSNGGDYYLTPNGEAYLQKESTQDFKPSDINRVLKSEIHRITKVSQEGAISVVLSWGDTNTKANVYTNEKIEKFSSAHRRLTELEIADSLQKTQELIKKLFN